jgi:hypothetical protein
MVRLVRWNTLLKNQILSCQLVTWIVHQQYTSRGLYYKHVMIINEDSSIVIKWSFKLIDDPRVVIYDRHRFIIQAIGDKIIQRWILFKSFVWWNVYWQNLSTNAFTFPLNWNRFLRTTFKKTFLFSIFFPFCLSWWSVSSRDIFRVKFSKEKYL